MTTEIKPFLMQINYDNKDSGGQMKITLETELDVSTCKNAALKVNNTDPAVVQRRSHIYFTSNRSTILSGLNHHNALLVLLMSAI